MQIFIHPSSKCGGNDGKKAFYFNFENPSDGYGENDGNMAVYG